MGQATSVDTRPPELAEVIAFRPDGQPLPAARHRSNLKIWRFFATSANPLDIRSAAVAPASFAGFEANECYVLLHTYRRKDSPAQGGAAEPQAAPPQPPVTPAFAASRGASSTAELASSTQQLFTPRGLAGPFSGYDDSGPYPFERRDTSGEPPVAHDIYIWNGKAALALTKAVALTKCFELERFLINDDVGAIHYLHRGACGPGGEQLPADALYRADYRPPKLPEAREDNHLLALLCGHADGQPIECSSLLACMLPSLSAASVPHAQFPELHKALFAAVAPANALPPEPPAGMVQLALADVAPPPPAAPFAADAADAAADADADAAPPSPSPPPAAAPPRLAMPKLGGLGGLRDAAGGDDATGAAGAAPPSATPRLALPPRPASAGASKPGGAGVGAGAPPLPLASASGLGGSGIGLDLKRVHELEEQGAMPVHERDNKAERLRVFSVICSEITPQVFLGGDVVARDLPKLQEHGITHVLNAAGVACPNYHEGASSLQRPRPYLTLHLFDSPDEDISTVMYDAVSFVERVVAGGGKVYIHCHQGVSRSSAIAIAYLMWTNGWGYEPAYTHVRARRGVASPNAGFIARLMQMAQRLAAPTPIAPRLYRMAPAYTAPRARSVDGVPSAAQLDPRTAVVLHTPRAAYVWAGKRAHDEYVGAARAWAKQLEKFEAAPPAQLVQHGAEPDDFWAALGGRAEVPPKVAAWDGDYGVGKTPSIKPPELELRPPPPGWAAPPPATYQPPPPPSASAAPPETPRGRGTSAGGAAAPPEPAPPPKPAAAAELYECNDEGEWEEMGMFDSDDLDEERVFVLFAKADGIISSHGTCFVWVGAEADGAQARQMGNEFARAKGLSDEMPLEIVRSGEEPGVFWSYFVNG